MKSVVLATAWVLLLGVSSAQAAAPIVTGGVPAGSTTGVSVQVETMPLATTTEQAAVDFPEIAIDVVAAQKGLAETIATSTSAVTVPTIATTAEELKEYANFLAGAHLAISSLKISSEKIELGYQLPAKLLFFIPIHYTAVATITTDGRLKDFQVPGWLWLVQDQATATKTLVSSVLDKLVTALEQSTDTPPSLFLLKQKQLSVALAALKKASGQ
jgi:hypothetical protein